jgi:TonB family protein
MKIKKTLSYSFILSVAIHMMIALFLFLQNNDVLKRLAEQKKPVEVELVDAEKFLESVKKAHTPDHTPKGQIVQQEDQLNDEIDEKTRFLSKHNQKVIKQEQAALNGQFKNSDDSSGEKKEQKKLGKTEETKPSEKVETAQAEKMEKAEKELLTSNDGPAFNGKKPTIKDLMPSFRPAAPQVNAKDVAAGGGEGPSATDDHLKDVKTGMQTLLSTREFLYYSYYNRIRSKLGQYWQPKIKEKMERIIKQGRTIASEGDKITRIIIVLDEKGILQKVQILGSAGVSDLDEAAVEAFRAAAPFPNPPKGMVDNDGTIKIRWDFILEANASTLFDAVRKSKIM